MKKEIFNFSNFQIELYNADCLEVFKLLPAESIDLILTDPPYNISQKGNHLSLIYKNRRRKKVKLDFGEWDYNFQIEPFLIESKRVLKENGSILVWTSEQLYGKYRDWFGKNMYPKHYIVWVKTNPLTQLHSVGYRRATELIIWAMKQKNTKDNPNFNFLGQKEMKNVFYAPIVSGKERKHPTQKPVSITKELIIRHCRENGLVLDPFMGSGTTAVACIELQRNFIGVEIDEGYFEIAKERIKQKLSQPALNFRKELT